MTVREALAGACADLKNARIDTPTLDASLLLARILNISRASLAAMGPDPLSEDNHASFRVLVERRLNGECTAYILGKKEFRNLEFLVNPQVLVPRPDTETLVEAALAIINEQLAVNNERRALRRTGRRAGRRGGVAANGIKVLDLCTGSGAVAVSLKNEMPYLEVYAADISQDALETAKTNAARLLPAGSIHFFNGDLYKALPHSPFSLIVCNPPYIPSGDIQTLPAEVQNEPLLALDGGPSGTEIIERVIDGAPEKLPRGGALLLEADPHQMEKITVLLEKKGFRDIKLYKDLSGQNRVIGGFFE